MVVTNIRCGRDHPEEDADDDIGNIDVGGDHPEEDADDDIGNIDVGGDDPEEDSPPGDRRSLPHHHYLCFWIPHDQRPEGSQW